MQVNEIIIQRLFDPLTAVLGGLLPALADALGGGGKIGEDLTEESNSFFFLFFFCYLLSTPSQSIAPFIS